MGDIMGFAIPATDAATRAMALRFAELMGRYDVARATLIDIAGVRAQHCIAKLLAPHDADGLDVLTSSIEDARELLHAFKRTQESWAQALKQMAAAAINAQSVVDSGFSRLLEKYIEFRAAGNREIADDERTVSSHGFIDFGEPWNIQHTGFTFGKFSDASSTVQGQIDQKRLTDLGFQRGNPPRSGWKVDISLTDVNKQGSVVLKQGSAGPHEREHKIEGAIEDRLRAVGGIEEIWRRFDSVTLGTHVIWGNKH
jgi:hypothetical protein